MPNHYLPGQLAQAIPLQPKAVSTYREVWRKIRDNGFDVIPLRGRDGPFKGWPSMPNDDAAIATWRGKSAGIRMFGSNMFVIDLDVRSEQVCTALLQRLDVRWPKFMRSCLWRTSGSTTMALIGRVSTVRKRQWTARFKSDTDKSHLVEYFTGNDKRYVGVHGYHSEGREYDYIGPRNILNCPINELPFFPEVDIPNMITECERVMLGLGLEQIVVPRHAYGEKVYDLEPNMVITLSTGERVTLAELEKIAGVRRIKASASLWDPQSKTPDRVLVNATRTSGLTLWDTKHDVSHRWASLAPVDDIELRRMLSSIKHPWEAK